MTNQKKNPGTCTRDDCDSGIVPNPDWPGELTICSDCDPYYEPPTGD
ncbi:hypothetical protein JNUCC64_09520 [Streptomyces sp. JNUCC 64]